MSDAVSVWSDAVRLVTGRPLTRQSVAETKVLLDVLEAHGPKPIDEAVEWAREKGELFAKSQPPAFNAFKFKDWVDNGFTWNRGLASRGGGKLIQAEPPEGRGWKTSEEVNAGK